MSSLLCRRPRVFAVAALFAAGCGSGASDGTLADAENGGTRAVEASASYDAAASPGADDSSAQGDEPDGASNDVTDATAASDGIATGDSNAPSDANTESDVAQKPDASEQDAATGQPDASSSTKVTGPCDIYGTGGTPCVAAHSTVRALYGNYNGNLYQVRRASDKSTTNVPVLARGGFANASVQDAFCAGTTCTISIIYDQSPEGNDLPVANGGKEAPAGAAKISLGGHEAYGVYVVHNVGTAYRNNKTKGIATGDDPEAMYMVLDGKRFTAPCCFDYGNAETDGKDDGNATMEAIYWGTDTIWSRGVGNGPWVCGDLENGMYKGDLPKGVTPPPPTNTPVTGMAFVTAMLKGPSGNHFGLKAGNAQSGALATKWDGPRPPGYSPMKKEGAIILGTGGDGSDGGDGTFFEGCMTSGNPSNATDDAVQANIVAAGYGH
jgi:hypothetical protein